MKWNENIQMILLTVSVIIMMVMFAITVWDVTFKKDDEMIRQEQER